MPPKHRGSKKGRGRKSKEERQAAKAEKIARRQARRQARRESRRGRRRRRREEESESESSDSETDSEIEDVGEEAEAVEGVQVDGDSLQLAVQEAETRDDKSSSSGRKFKNKKKWLKLARYADAGFDLENASKEELKAAKKDWKRKHRAQKKARRQARREAKKEKKERRKARRKSGKGAKKARKKKLAGAGHTDPKDNYEVGRHVKVFRQGTEQVFMGSLRKAASVLVETPLSEAFPWFEVEVKKTGLPGKASIVVGLSDEDHPVNKLPGFAEDSVGYHFGNGFLYLGRGQEPREMAKGVKDGDKIGCGIRVEEGVTVVFWTLNSEQVASYNLPEELAAETRYPVVGLNHGARVTISEPLDPNHLREDEEAKAAQDADWAAEEQSLEEQAASLSLDGGEAEQKEASVEQALESLDQTLLPVAPERAQLTEGVFMDKYRHQTHDGYIFEWVIVNQRLNCLEVTLDYTGTENFDLSGDVVQTETVRQYESKKVGSIKQIDIYAASRLGLSYSLKLLPPEEEAVKEAAASAQASIDETLAKIAELGITEETPADEIVSLCVANNIKYIDQQFLPVDASMFPPEVGSNPFTEASAWRRPEEFLGADVQLFHGIDPVDIAQGRLGNCWFVCALSSLAEFPELVEHLFEDVTANSAGIYVLRMCKNGEWQTVVLDDLVPCYPDQGPIFSQNRGPELWVLLAEKAYAKLHRDYMQLKSGNPSDALADLTGLPVDYFNLDSSEMKEAIATGEFWETLLHLGQEEQLMAAGSRGTDKYTELGIDPENEAGLVGGHAYSILDVQQYKDTKLLQLRNPWGRFEWKGDWSDSSPLWTPEYRAAFLPEFGEDDGIFWMSYDDFLKYFGSVNVCYLRSHDGNEWVEDRAKTTVTLSTETGDASTASHYTFTSTEPVCNYYVSVHQADKRDPESPAYIDVGVRVVNENGLVVADSQLEMNRENQVDVALGPGTYTVIPYTGGSKLRQLGEESRTIMLSVHADVEGAATLTEVPVDTELEAAAWIHSLKAECGKRALATGLYVYSGWAGNSWSLAVEATSDLPANGAELTFDCSASQNAATNRASLVQTAQVKKGSAYVYHSIAPIDKYQGVSASYGMSGRFF